MPPAGRVSADKIRPLVVFCNGYLDPGSFAGFDAAEDPRHVAAQMAHDLHTLRIGGCLLGLAADAEGMQIMRNLGRNMAWILRCIEAGKAAGIEVPVAENDKRTNFIR